MLLISLENGIKNVSFNLPKKKNPITIDILESMLQMLEDSKTDGTKVVVLRGEGGNFSAGADLSGGVSDPRFADVTTYLRTYINPITLAMRASAFPILAQVQGVCVGVGCSFVLACDMIYADKTAIFSQIFAKVGLATDGGGAFFMSKAVGYHKAFELVSTAAMIPATDALRLGLVNQVLEDEVALQAQIDQMTTYFANAPSVAIAKIKQNLHTSSQSSLAETLEQEAINQGICFQTADFMEGVMAFIEKRKATFQGK
jgi:2-(1,2-epoxy-1,2-dihydrophenyl)acetyl-CoA isomerase